MHQGPEALLALAQVGPALVEAARHGVEGVAKLGQLVVAAHRDPMRQVVRAEPRRRVLQRDRKSTRLNSSHVAISYAVFCLKKKKKKYLNTRLEYKNKR